MSGKDRGRARGGGVERAARVLDELVTQSWARGGDAGLSSGSRHGWGVSVWICACLGALMAGNAAGVQAKGDCGLGELDSVGRGDRFRWELAQWREERQGRAVARPCDLARPFDAVP